ncbi:DUF2304 domain-containing protein [Oscillospiraceae bacterium 21-37]|jgi:hypothetical protein|uniref:DUF2304 domain-containing protein n=1 Tax=Acutalibacter sp. JLR.KK004 TaxID=3112622 RepID=UPI00216D60F5|nr:DUF2304 domain-containing protein [Acutalibacter sp.]
MGLLLRIEMIVMAVLVVFIIIHNVNRKRLRIQYSFVWLLIALSLLAVAFFPGIVIWLCSIMSIETPVNLIYLLGIFALLLITFYQTLVISRQADRITRLTQIVSIEKFLAEREKEEHDSKDEKM